MSKRPDDSVYIKHIRDAIARVESYVGDVNESTFLETPMIQDAVIRQIQIIGEAAKRISVALREQTLRIPWADVAGMRDKLVHDYMGVNLDAVWITATRDVPALKSELESLLDSE